jgi:hypothetical protein
MVAQPDLVELAQQYVSLSNQLETVRNAMRAALDIGLGADREPPPGPTQARSKPGKKIAELSEKSAQKPTRRDTVMARSRADDEQVVAALKQGPMRLTTLLETTGQKSTTLQNRLARLQTRGLVQKDDGGAWTATSSP